MNWEYANSPDRVIHFNRHARSFEPGEFFDDHTWPIHHFVVGSEHEQNWYFIDPKAGGEFVFPYHHDRGDIHREAASLGEFPSALLQWWREVESRG